MGRAFCSRPVASILPAWGFQKLPACCLHIYIPHSRTSACGSLALARLTTLTGDLQLAPLGCPRFSHRGGGLFRIPRAPWISGWQRPAGCIDASHSAEGGLGLCFPLCVSIITDNLLLVKNFFAPCISFQGSCSASKGVGQNDLAVMTAEHPRVYNPVVVAGDKPVASGADSVHSQYLHYYYCPYVDIPRIPPRPASRGTSQPLLTLI